MRFAIRCGVVPALWVSLALAACGDGSTDPPGGGESISLSALSSSVAQGATIVQLSDAQRAISEMSGVISQIIATDGFPLGCGDCHPSGIPSEVSRRDVLGPALERHEGYQAALHVRPPRTALRPGLSAATLAVPVRANLLGTTCVWNPADDFWGNDPSNPYGDPAPDAVFFELYEAQDARPIIPLSPLDGYASVAPRGQGPQVDVGISVALDGQTLVDFGATGTADGEGSFDIAFDGTISDDGTSDEIVYSSDLSPTQGRTTARVLDIEVDELLSVGSTGAFSFDLEVGQTSGDRQRLTFDIEVDGQSLAVTSGSILLDGEIVGTVSGNLSGPIFDLTPDSPLGSSERARLEGIFTNASIITGGIFEHVLFGACVGTLDHSVCTTIDPGAPSPP